MESEKLNTFVKGKHLYKEAALGMKGLGSDIGVRVCLKLRSTQYVSMNFHFVDPYNNRSAWFLRVLSLLRPE